MKKKFIIILVCLATAYV